MNQLEDSKITSKFMWEQWTAGIGAALIVFEMGLMGGWIVPYLAKLSDQNLPSPMSLQQASWLMTFFLFGKLFGTLSGSISVAYFGSKTTLLILGTPLTFSWLFILLAVNYIHLFVGRLFGGIAMGMAQAGFANYLGEIGHPKIRGTLTVSSVIGGSLGVASMSILGSYLRIEMTAGMALVPCFVTIGLFAWLPESPHHLIRAQRLSKAKESLNWYRRDCRQSDKEFDSLVKFITSTKEQCFWKNLNDFKNWNNFRITLIPVILFMYSQMSGVYSIVPFTGVLLETGNITVINLSQVITINCIASVIGSCVSILMIDRLGRKILMSLACAIGSISLLGLGFYFEMNELGLNVMELQLLPVVTLFLFTLSLFMGILPVPMTVLGEILPPNTKYIGIFVVSISSALFATISSIISAPLSAIFGQKWLIWLHSVFLMTAVPYVMLFLPETKGKTLERIQNDLNA